MNFKNDIGTNLYLGGFVLVGREDPTVVLFPETELFPQDPQYTGWDSVGLAVFKPTFEEFKEIIRQMDVMETEITNTDGSKAIVRKSQRSLDNRITWQVFKRDEFKCRYCGADDVPLSYDHVMLWEKGGANTVENGVSACTKCNKQRGNMEYYEWLTSDVYLRKSRNVEPKFKDMNRALITVYQSFEPRISKKSRP